MPRTKPKESRGGIVEPKNERGSQAAERKRQQQKKRKARAKAAAPLAKLPPD